MCPVSQVAGRGEYLRLVHIVIRNGKMGNMGRI